MSVPGVERGHIDGVAVCRMFNHAIAKKPLPKYLATDNVHCSVFIVGAQSKDPSYRGN